MRQGGVLAAGGAEACFLTTPLAVSAAEIDTLVSFCAEGCKAGDLWMLARGLAHCNPMPREVDASAFGMV